MFQQIIAVTGINLRSIPQRAGLSIATVLSIALVVAVLLGFLAMANGFRATLASSGAEDIAIVMRSGSMSEVNSVMAGLDQRLIEQSPGIVLDDQGLPMVSGEFYVIVDGTKRSSQTDANLPLRGVGPQAWALRDGFAMVEGRMFEEGMNELIVGEAILREFSGFEIGETVRLGTNEWVIVGTFSTGGSVFDSEIWTDIRVLQNLYQRGLSMQSVRVRLTSTEAIEDLRAYVESEPRLNVDIQTETEFFSGQAGGTTDFILYMGWPLTITMAIGALAGAWNTMYSSVDARIREIATLRAIGFGGFAAAIGTMIESLLLAGLGGLIGSVAIFLLLDGISASTLGSSFAQIVFSFEVTPMAILNGVALSLIVGFLGGLAPAIRAATIPLLAVHRS